jgi:hypothetical protein
MKSTSRLLGSIAIASALGIAPSVFAKGGGVTTATVRPTTTKVFQPALDPLGPNPSSSAAMAVTSGGNGHVFRVIPPPLGPSISPVQSSVSAVSGNGHVFRVIPPPFMPSSTGGGPGITTFNQRPVAFNERPVASTARPIASVNNNMTSTIQSLRSTTSGLNLGTSTTQGLGTAAGGQSTTQALRSTTGALNPDQDATVVMPATP